MYNEGLVTHNHLIKIFIMFLCTSIRQDKEIKLKVLDCNWYMYMYVIIQS